MPLKEKMNWQHISSLSEIGFKARTATKDPGWQEMRDSVHCTIRESWSSDCCPHGTSLSLITVLKLTLQKCAQGTVPHNTGMNSTPSVTMSSVTSVWKHWQSCCTLYLHILMHWHFRRQGEAKKHWHIARFLLLPLFSFWNFLHQTVFCDLFL